MNTAPWPELITTTTRTLAGSASSDTGASGGFTDPPVETGSEPTMEGITMGAVLFTDQLGVSMEGVALGAVLLTDQLGVSMEGVALGTIFISGEQTGVTMEGIALGVILIA